VYNPLEYAWKSHVAYLSKYASSPKKIVFLGMNPGPWGMAQTGVPFGEIPAIRDWLKISELVDKPKQEHPNRPIVGFNCARSEVSGRRLWGLFKERFSSPDIFFKDHFVANYCPLVFMEESGKNRTPDKLPAHEANLLYNLCDDYLRQTVNILKPDWLIGVGGFAEARAQEALKGIDIKIGRILHPSPASPAANKDWSGKVTQQLTDLNIWS